MKNLSYFPVIIYLLFYIYDKEANIYYMMVDAIVPGIVLSCTFEDKFCMPKVLPAIQQFPFCVPDLHRFLVMQFPIFQSERVRYH